MESKELMAGKLVATILENTVNHLRGQNEELTAKLAEVLSQHTPEPDYAAMVSKFLGWRLPRNFSPDCGISFKREGDFDHPVHGRHQYDPVGTNLFDAEQALEMFKHCVVYKPTPEIVELNNNLTSHRDGLLFDVSELRKDLEKRESQVVLLKSALDKISELDGTERDEWDAVERLLPLIIKIADDALLELENS